MANNIQQYNQPLPPAPAESRRRVEAGESLHQRFVQGISTPYAIMSIRGKEFSLKHNGQESVLPSNELEVVLINSSNLTNKAFYIKGYDGNNDQPDCYSLDSVKPDPASPHIQSPTCSSCPWNRFGSAKSQDGTPRKGKACSDSRKLVLAFQSDLIGNQLGPIMLRVPVTSHQNMASYINYLRRNSYDVNACTTVLKFDRAPDGSALSFPKLSFGFGQPLNEDDYALAREWTADERTENILRAPPEGELPSEEGSPEGRPDYNAALAVGQPKPRPEPAVRPRPEPEVQQRQPEPKAEPPMMQPNIVKVGDRLFDLANQKWVEEAQEDRPQPEPEVTWTPPQSAPSYQQEVTQQVTPPKTTRTRKPAPPTIEATANPEVQAESVAPTAPNGPAAPAPKALENILATLMPKR